MSMGDDGQMIFGDLGGLKLPDICLAVRKRPEKTPSRKLVPTGDRIQAHCVPGAQVTTWSTAVDNIIVNDELSDGIKFAISV